MVKAVARFALALVTATTPFWDKDKSSRKDLYSTFKNIKGIKSKIIGSSFIPTG